LSARIFSERTENLLFRNITIMALLSALSLSGVQRSVAQADTVVIVSLDGFRADYLERYDTPNIDWVIEHGMTAEDGMRPVFPTTTFPNHYSMATGLYPQDHGIVGNTFFDPDIDEWFYISNKDAQNDPRWWYGEPFWKTVEQAGRKAATFFWVGSEVEGNRASRWQPYASVPFSQRVDSLQAWLSLPDAEIPSLIALYFPEPDGSGHQYGPFSQEMGQKVSEMDQWVGSIVDVIQGFQSNRKITLLVVSDHGMEKQNGQAIYLSDYISDQDVVRSVVGPSFDLTVPEDKVDSILQSLVGAHPELDVYAVNETPEEWKIAMHPRRGQIVGSSTPGWYIRWDRSQSVYTGGTHGYDNRHPSMFALFAAYGPGIEPGKAIPSFDIIHVHKLVLSLLGLPSPEGSSSSLEPFLQALSTSKEGTPGHQLNVGVKAHPNPFNTFTTITYTIPTSSRVRIVATDLLGRHVSTLVDGEVKPAGSHSIQFAAENLASGTYLIRVEAERFLGTQRVVLLK
jgi:predicted AlkP superfamily pyrophosphatase or phosphodiesterase